MSFSPYPPDGRWGFEENWPRRSEAPVFDVLFGDRHVARVSKQDGAWRVLLRESPQIDCPLVDVLGVLGMVADRMRAFEQAQAQQAATEAARQARADAAAGWRASDALAAKARPSGDPGGMNVALGRLFEGLAAGSNGPDAVRWGDAAS